MSKVYNEIAISVNDLHVYYRDMKRFSIKRNGFKDKGSGKLFKAIKGVSFENVVNITNDNASSLFDFCE